MSRYRWREIGGTKTERWENNISIFVPASKGLFNLLKDQMLCVLKSSARTGYRQKLECPKRYKYEQDFLAPGLMKTRLSLTYLSTEQGVTQSSLFAARHSLSLSQRAA